MAEGGYYLTGSRFTSTVCNNFLAKLLQAAFLPNYNVKTMISRERGINSVAMSVFNTWKKNVYVVDLTL